MSAENTLTRRQFLGAAAAGSLTALIAACAQPTPTPTPQPAPAQAATQAPDPTQAPAATEVPKGTTLPIVKEPLTLTYWVEFNPTAFLKDYNDKACYQEFEKRTGIHIDFQHPPASQAGEQFNLMIASGRYPDLVQYNWLSVPGGPAKAIKDGVILRLNSVIDEYARHLKSILDDHLEWKKMVMTDEGDMYVFPFLRGDPYLLTFGGPVIRKDWLDKVDLPMPTTLDEWRTMLEAFKEKDPNGNGKPDEIPFSPWWNGSLGAYTRHAFVGAWGITMSFYQDQGAVRYGPLQPEFKEFLKTMAAWHEDGLVDPDFAALDKKAMNARVTGHQLGSFVTLTGGGIGYYMGLMADEPGFKLAAAPYPVLQAGEKPQLGQKQFTYPGQASAAITTACKHVKEAAQWLDYAYSPEGHMIANFGIEGVSYEMENGYPRYTEEITKNPNGLPMVDALALYVIATGGPFAQDKRYMEQFAALPEQKEAIEIWMQPTNEKLMPPVTPTQEESGKFASVMNEVNTRFNEAVVKVLTGIEPVENWDGVVGQLKQMGIEEAISIQQAALERYNKR